MSEIKVNRISNENNIGGPTISGITTFSSTSFLDIPKGNTAQRGTDCPAGSLRFNTDSGHLEYFNGLLWVDVETNNNDLNGGNRAIFFGGRINDSPIVDTNTIDYITISSTGNATDFGDTLTKGVYQQSASSNTRGVYFVGRNTASAFTNILEYVTISSTGNAIDFGDITGGTRDSGGACSSQTRGLFGGGTPTSQNAIDYITIASIGNSVDFGDLTRPGYGLYSFSSSTRGVWGGGTSVPTFTLTNVIDYVTISSTGNASDFGDLTVARRYGGGFSNSTRGIFAAGLVDPTNVNTIDYITIASTGNAVDFGDSTTAAQAMTGSSSSTRGVYGGGISPGFSNTIEYITILSLGNSLDFGDLSEARVGHDAISNGHGGL